MSEPKGNTAQNRLLLTGIGLLIIIILGLLVLLAAYPTVFAPAPTPTSASQVNAAIQGTPTLTPTITPTPTETHTPRPSFTPTATLTPSITPTPTLTPVPLGPATLTPEAASPSKAYTLQGWSPENADYVIEMMEAYPNLLTKNARGKDDQNYYHAFLYATVAEKEALLRYPDAPQANKWAWDLAYDLARLGAAEAGDRYAALIADGLNSGDATPEQLDTWFLFQEPRLTMNITEVTPPPDYLSARLVKLGGEGSAYLLLLETPSGFRAFPISSNFDFVHAPESSSFAGDLTGDGVDEVVIYPSTTISDTVLVAPQVFNLAKIPPTELSFDPSALPADLGTNFKGQWESVLNSAGSEDLRFRAQLFPACPVQMSRTYRWNGNWFSPDQSSYEVKPNPSTLSYCRYNVEDAADAWGLEPTIQLMETILPSWPPEKDENGKPFPADALDEWRYRLGVYHALAGDQEKAHEYFNKIVVSPSTPGSSWITPAQNFLAEYKKPDDIYKACVKAEFCDPRQAIEYLVNAMPAGAYPRAMTILWQDGVTLRSSGYFDFDGDGVKESWFTVRNHPGEKLEFWTLIAWKDHVRAFFIDTIDSNLPALTYYQEDKIPPIVLIDDASPFSIQRAPDSLEPYLTKPTLPSTYPNRFQDGLDAAKLILFSGKDPTRARQALLALQRSPGLLCKGTWSCDEYYYMLGMAAELAEDQTTAVAAYLNLWRDYSRSPFTTIARLKLRGVFIPPTPTSSPTITPTPLPTTTPTVTLAPRTATPTATVAGTPAATQPSGSATVTPTPGTPYPVYTPPTSYP